MQRNIFGGEGADRPAETPYDWAKWFTGELDSIANGQIGGSEEGVLRARDAVMLLVFKDTDEGRHMQRYLDGAVQAGFGEAETRREVDVAFGREGGLGAVEMTLGTLSVQDQVHKVWEMPPQKKFPLIDYALGIMAKEKQA